MLILRDFHAGATVHRGLVGADAGSRPAGRPHCVRPGQAFFGPDLAGWVVPWPRSLSVIASRNKAWGARLGALTPFSRRSRREKGVRAEQHARDALARISLPLTQESAGQRDLG